MSRPRTANAPADPLMFRPVTYWPADSLRLAVVGNIKGQVRRQTILRELEAGGADAPPAELLRPELSDSLREHLGRLHPTFMGGEYLPGYGPDEVEIARVAMRSTTADVISLRARFEEDGLIHYQVVDEYDTPFHLPITTSEDPLSMADIIRILDESSAWGCTGLVLGILENNLSEGDDVGGLRDFLRVESDFYPGLSAHYRARCNALLDRFETQGNDHEA